MQDDFVEFQIILEKLRYGFITNGSTKDISCDGSGAVTVASMIY